MTRILHSTLFFTALLVTVLVFSRCKILKRTPSTMIDHTSILRIKQTQVLDFHTLETKLKIRLEQPKKINARGVLRMETGKHVWLSTLFMGIEVARLYADTAQIQLLDKTQKRHHVLTFEALSHAAGYPITLSHLQQLLYGKAIQDLEDPEMTFLQEGDTLDASRQWSEKDVTLEMQFVQNTLLHQILDREKGNFRIHLDYSPEYLERKLPKSIHAFIPLKDPLNIVLEPQKVSFDKDLNFPFNVSEKYNTLFFGQ